MKLRYNSNQEKTETSDVSSWVPKTKIGQMVKNKEIASIEQIFSMGKSIKEVEIIDSLVPNMTHKIIEIASVQRMTKNSRKQRYRVTAVVGDGNGHVGVGTAKDVEVKPAIASAIKDAKMNMISVRFGCGSWECACGTEHSLPMRSTGKCGSSQIILKPAPRGVGVVANKVVKNVLTLAGVKDAWSFSSGMTRDTYNVAIATYRALNQTNTLKNTGAIKS